MVDIPARAEAEDNLEKPYDASDEAAVSAARKKGGRNRRARLEFIQAMMELPEGRKWLWEFMEFCYIHGNPVVQGDPYMTHFNIGKQDAGKKILSDTTEFPELYVMMAKEAKERK